MLPVVMRDIEEIAHGPEPTARIAARARDLVRPIGRWNRHAPTCSKIEFENACGGCDQNTILPVADRVEDAAKFRLARESQTDKIIGFVNSRRLVQSIQIAIFRFSEVVRVSHASEN